MSPPAVSPVPPVEPDAQVFARASVRLRRSVPFDAAGWFAVDPATVLPANPVLIENVEQGRCRDYWHRENTVEDVLLFRDLARSDQPAATLLAATDGNLRRSARYRDFLRPLAYGDELRVAMRAGGRTWGVAVLMRRVGRPPFTAREVDRVAAAGSQIAASLATIAAVTQPDVAPTGPDHPGIAVFGPDDALVSMDLQAQRWFTELAGEGWWDKYQFRTVSTALAARAAAVTAGRDDGPATVRLRAPSGRWLTVTASRQAAVGGAAASTALVIMPASSSHVAPILLDAYGLTAREQEVTRAVASGLSTNEIAAELHLSPHTVRDHLKAVFRKVGVASRGELVATLFDDIVGPGIEWQAAHTHW